MRRSPCLTAAVVLAATSLVSAERVRPPSTWDRLQVLLGTWQSKGDTQLGEGSGTASFTSELGGHAIVRRSFAEYSSGPQAGTRHDDLLVVYRANPDAEPQAIYFDSEGHVIHYRVLTPKENAVVFESDGSDPGPRYRLSYARQGNTLDGIFELAMPGADYKVFVSWTSTKR